MKPIVADGGLVAYCGLYCGACRAWRRGRCPGCRENEKATWCKVRRCCVENGWGTCAACDEVGDVADCGKFNNFIARLFGLIFRSDRRACVLRIGEVGVEAFTAEMAEAWQRKLHVEAVPVTTTLAAQQFCDLGQIQPDLHVDLNGL